MKQWKFVTRRNTSRNQGGLRKKRLWKIGLGIFVLLIKAIIVLTVVPAVFPGVGATMADILRGALGPQPVAQLESLSFRFHDILSRNLYKNGSPQIQWSTSTPLKQLSALSVSHAHGNLAPVYKGKISNVVIAAPQVGWQAYGPQVNGSYAMARTLISPDPNRPYAAVALVRMDLSKLQLHMMPGNLEPSHSAQVVQMFPSLGIIPLSDQNSLIAAFNGGFKTVNGHYGMMVNGVTLVPPRPNAGTVAIYRDGRVQIGAWGKDILPSADILALRQNCPPLIDAGTLSPDLAVDNRNEWGYTGNTDITWRTGVGISEDGRYLIYAVGNGTSAKTLAQVLKQAGAYAAIQLDINEYYAHFVTYQPAGTSTSGEPKLQAERLLDKMINEANLYLTPSVRDFFYLTAK